MMNSEHFRVLTEWDYGELNKIYIDYFKHKQFYSFMPVFYEDFRDNTILGYFHNDALVALTLMIEYPSQLSVSSDQFAWNYAEPKLHLGIASWRNECAYYKQRGFEYLYLEGADEYKQQIQGFEILGPVDNY